MASRRHIDFDLVLQTAITLADESSFEAVTLAHVAEQLGIRIPSLYNYVPSLAGLRYEMRLWAMQQMGEQVRRAAIGKSGDAAILSVADAYRGFALAHPGVYPATLRAPKPDEPEIIAAQEVIEVLFVLFEPYGFSGDDLLHAIRALRSLMHGFVDLEAAGGFGLDLNRDESYQRLMQMFLVSLRSDSTPRG